MSEPQPSMEMNRESGSGQNAVLLRDARASGAGVRTSFWLFVLLLATALPAHAQHRVTGRVTEDPSGAPLSGVQIVVQGTTVGTITNADGRFQLTAPSATGTLVFSRIGYRSQQAPINNQAVVNVALQQTATELEGIVVVGYGQKARANLTEAIGTVSAEQIQRVTVASPEAAIQGRVTGAQITSESGIPGAPVAVRIRGVGTVGNNQPLYVIDGVPIGKGQGGIVSPLATLNPADIESISVLKDASAASVYGMQAANGVILITTKRGTVGKPTIQYDMYTGVQRFPRFYELNNSQNWLSLWEEANANRNAYDGRAANHPDAIRMHPDLLPGSARRSELLQTNTDWTRVAIRDNAPIQSHNASVSGATDQVRYFISAGYFGQDAIQEKWDLDRYTFRANSDFTITPRIRIGETFTVSNQVTHRGAANYGDGTILNNLLRQPPIFLAYDPTMISPTNPLGLTGNFNVAGITQPNLNSTNQLQDVTDRYTRMLGSVYGEVDLLRGMSFRSQNSVDYNLGNRYVWQPRFTNAMTGFERAQIGEDIREDSHALTSTNTLNYNIGLGRHDFGFLAGSEINLWRSNSLSLQTTNFLNDQYELRRIVSLGDQVLKKGGGAGEVGRLGYFGRLSYNFADRYLVTGTLRHDGVSTFAPGYKWGTFPAVSAAWRVSQEPFFDVPWVNELKVRGSWGQLGNSEIAGGSYPHLVNVLLWAEYEIGGAVRLAPTPQPRLANEALSWEKNETTDFGVEGSLFGNAVDFSATYFRRDTRDFLLNVPTPVSSGFTSAPTNVGMVRNSGMEFELGYNTRVANRLDVGVSGNLTTLDNKLVSITEGVDVFTTSGWYRTEVGMPIGYFYGFRTCGIHTAQSAAAAPTDASIGGRKREAGDLCIQDINGREDGRIVAGANGTINDDDRTYLGKTIPDMYYGLNLNLGYGRFDATAFFNGVQGVQRINELRRGLESMAGGSNNQLTTTANRWTPENPSGTMPRAIAGDPAGNNRNSDRWIEDADFFRLKTLQLGYTLPDNLLGSGVRGTRVYLSATNLLTFTGYSGLDPEFTSRGNAFGEANNQSQLSAGTDDGNVPQPRMFQIGISTSF
jgi:TonB-dependent starch-binding outer membrane protein SusC